MTNIPEDKASFGRAVAISLLVAVLFTPLAVWLADALQLGPIDDAYISLRYADNWANGRGLAFNPGEKVEGYTNFLMVALEATAIKIGLDPEASMSAIGWFSLALLVFVQTLAVALLLTPGRWLLTIVVAIALACHPMLICWGASGMETCLFAALVMASFLIAVAGTFTGWSQAVGVLLALAGMTRPEAVALVPIAVWVTYSRHRDLGEACRVFAWFAGLYGLYFGIRWWHFGYLLPNTFYAKLDFGGKSIWERGTLYLWDFLRAAPLVSLLGLVAIARAWKGPLWIRTWSAVVVAQALIVVYEGGDHFAMFRFLLPTVPFLGMLALIWPMEWIEDRTWARQTRLAVTLLAIGLIGFSTLRLGRHEKRFEAPGVLQFARFRSEGQMTRTWSTMGSWLRQEAPEGASLATIAIGAIGFHSYLHVLDPYGLTDPEIAHRQVDLGSGYAGHEKFDIDSVFERRPTYLLLANLLTSKEIPADRLQEWTWGAFGRGALADPRLEIQYRYQPVEVMPGQWMNIHVRQGASPAHGTVKLSP